MVNIPDTSWEQNHSLGAWDISLPPKQYTPEKIGNIIWTPTDIFDMARKITSWNYQDFLYKVSILSYEEQDRVMDFLIGEGMVDIFVYIHRELDHSYHVSRESLLKWLSLIKMECSDDILLEYIFLSDDPKSMIRKVAELWYLPLCLSLFEKFPDMPLFSNAECSTLFNAYFSRQSQLYDGVFLWGKNWENIFWTIFNDPGYAHEQFESIFQNLHVPKYEKLDEQIEKIQREYLKSTLLIEYRIVRRPTTYTDNSQKYLNDIIQKVWSFENISGKITLVNFHTFDGLVQVFLDTHKKIDIRHINPWQFFCHTKESFIQTIHDIASQLELLKSQNEIPYTVIVMREDGSKDTYPPAANDELYAQAA